MVSIGRSATTAGTRRGQKSIAMTFHVSLLKATFRWKNFDPAALCLTFLLGTEVCAKRSESNTSIFCRLEQAPRSSGSQAAFELPELRGVCSSLLSRRLKTRREYSVMDTGLPARSPTSGAFRQMMKHLLCQSVLCAKDAEN